MKEHADKTDSINISIDKSTRMVLSFLVILILCIITASCTRGKQETEQVLTIAILQDTRISDIENNYYKEWLEDQSGYQIQFEYISPGYEKEYLNAMLTTSYNTVDAVFLPEKQELLTKEEFNKFVLDGYIMDLTQYMDENCNLSKVLEKYGTEQTKVNYFPNIDTSRKAQNMQVLWLNIGWLKKLNLQVPRTIDDLAMVLQEFKEQDPNENGKQDELPIISCEADISLKSYYYLLNAFTYYNPETGGVYQDTHNENTYAINDINFREGIQYINNLYKSGILSDCCFDYTRRQLMELVNAPEDLVGAFTSQSIADVVYPNCSDILARYVQVAPITTEECNGNAVKTDYKWNIGGYIPSNSKHPKEVFELMDLMLSDDASLIAEFGEKDVDWKFSSEGDLSTYGSKAKITTLKYLEDSVQNKNFAGMGPHVLTDEYSNGVTWNGNNSLVEYIDARAVKSYEPYYLGNPEGGYSEGRYSEEAYLNKQLQDYTSEMIYRFIVGEQSAHDDQIWILFCKNYMEIIEQNVK